MQDEMWRQIEYVLDNPHDKRKAIESARKILAGTGWLSAFDYNLQLFGDDIPSIAAYYKDYNHV